MKISVMNYKEVIKEFQDAKNRWYLSDEYLKDNDCFSRETEPIAIEYPYGIVYLQDAAVEILINKIEELEEKLKEQTA
jgi:hypothetical protein